ncbi:MAG: tyrosine--tRNA ligase [Oscillospiraceae bacterium]|nr:tyrosine--tRNA ligase [Oscillospiraceae bacterium]
MKIFEELKERGLIAQMTHPVEVENALNNESISFYIGFDATADSFHIGNLFQLVTVRRLQMAGHRPILLVGGATTKIGDPTGKDEMRKMLSDEEIAHNIERFKEQFGKFVEVEEGAPTPRDARDGVPYEANGENCVRRGHPCGVPSGDREGRPYEVPAAIVVNNDDWIGKMSVYEFIRIGFNFNLNDMLRQECYAVRRESGGLSIGEMCYLPIQSLDFLHLYEKYGCRMQMGGDEQWSNILGGVDLIRKMKREKGNVFGITFNIITTSEGKKMGKSEKGAIWLDEKKTSAYEFYQYWRNVADADVIKSLKFMTFIPLDEIAEISTWQGAELNKAKEILAWELTKMVHGEEQANRAMEAARALFGGGADNSNMPTTKIDIGEGILLLDLMLEIGLIPSKGEGRRLIEQGGVAINDEKVTSSDYIVKQTDFTDGELIIRKGKKTFHKIIL